MELKLINTIIGNYFNTKDYYYFYLDRKYAFLINKNGFTLGNEKDFSNFIKTKCLFRYKTENM